MLILGDGLISDPIWPNTGANDGSNKSSNLTLNCVGDGSNLSSMLDLVSHQESAAGPQPHQ